MYATSFEIDDKAKNAQAISEHAWAAFEALLYFCLPSIHGEYVRALLSEKNV